MSAIAMLRQLTRRAATIDEDDRILGWLTVVA
jgi:hypothetical protein